MQTLLSATGIHHAQREYWDTAALTYDQDFASTFIGQLQRQTVWRDLDRIFYPPQRILELNCGTGIDAVHLAVRGVRVVACDISPGMVVLAEQRAQAAGCGQPLTFYPLATEDIDSLNGEGPFDGAFSNFSGMNCVADLPAVSRKLAHLLSPGSPLLLCMLGRMVPWEIAWFLAHRDWGAAIRRFRIASDLTPVKAGVEVHYPSVTEIRRAFAPHFALRRWKGLGVAIPPSYMDHWARRMPSLTRALAAVDNRIGGVPILRNMANFVLLAFERRHHEERV